jgi:hypothetical protein
LIPSIELPGAVTDHLISGGANPACSKRCGQVLTRAKLLEDVWHYKFVPEESNLVDVHMGKLRRKVDGPNDAPMICSVRGAGFILNATDLDPAGSTVQP